MRLVKFLSLFSGNELNKFKNTGARMLDSIYQMALKLLKIAFWRDNINILSSFTQRYNGRHYVRLLNLQTTSGSSILLHGDIYHSWTRCLFLTLSR